MLPMLYGILRNNNIFNFITIKIMEKFIPHDDSCKQCGKTFLKTMRIKLFCTRECKTRAGDLLKGIRRLDKQSSQKHFQETVFSEQKEKYKDRIIEYNGSPTGNAYIGFAKSPLMPNTNGIGYQGVLMQSENRSLVQCSECGKWMVQITSAHLKNHGLNSEEYKEKFGLNFGCGLISDVKGNWHAEHVVKVINDRGLRPDFEKVRENITKANTELTRSKERYKIKGTMQQKNKWGTCPEQLKFETVEYIHRFHKLPTTASKKRGGFSKVKTLISRFGSLNNAFKEYGLPIRQKMGAITEYLFNDGLVAYTKRGEGYNEIYNLMLSKCNILTNL